MVTVEVFVRVQDMLTSQRPTFVHPRRISSQYLLSRIAFCGVCGSTAIGTNGKSGQFIYYSCNNRFKKGKGVCHAPSINAKRLEEFVLDRIKENILTKENLKELLQITNQELAVSRIHAQQELDGIERAMQEVSIKLGRLYSALESGKVDIDDLAPRLKELRSEQKVPLEKQDEALAQMDEPPPPDVDLPRIQKLMGDMKVILESSTFLESKRFLRSFIRRVEYTENDVGIEYTVPVNLGGESTGTKEVLNTGLGSPASPVLRTYVWARFKFPEPKPPRPKPVSPRGPNRHPIIMAQAWQDRLDNGEVSCRADLARKLRVLRAHVTKVLKLLNLSAEVKETIGGFGDPMRGRHLRQSSLRRVSKLSDHDQLRWLEENIPGLGR